MSRQKLIPLYLDIVNFDNVQLKDLTPRTCSQDEYLTYAGEEYATSGGFDARMNYQISKYASHAKEADIYSDYYDAHCTNKSWWHKDLHGDLFAGESDMEFDISFDEFLKQKYPAYTAKRKRV